MKTLILGAVLTVLFAACASAPQRNEALEEARAEFQKLSQDPLAQEAASADMDAARKSLQQADIALQQHKRPEEGIIGRTWRFATPSLGGACRRNARPAGSGASRAGAQSCVA